MIHKSFFHISKRFSRSSFVSNQLPLISYFSTTEQSKPIFQKEKNIKTNKSTFITSEKIAVTPPEKEKKEPANENKDPTSKAKSFVKSPLTGVRGIQSNKALEISRIQKLDELSAFLAKPQNIILSLHERNLIYDKLSKLLFRTFAYKDECDYEKLIPLLDSFFSKLLVALQKSEDHKTYLALLNIPFPSFLAVNFESFYRVCLSDLLTKFPKLKPQEFLSVLGNLKPLFIRVNAKSELCQQVEKILTMYEDSIDTLNIQNKIRIINLMRRSQVYNYKILDFMLYYTEMNLENLTYEDLLKIVMTNIAAAKVMPYEILFRIRNRFNKQNNLRPSLIILTLAVFIRARLMFMEPLFENAFKRIQDPDFISSLRPREIVMILNYYSKSKYRDQQLFDSLFQELINNIQSVDKIYMKILLLALADLNYPDKETYAELYKTFNMLMKAEQKPFSDIIPDLEEEEYIQVIPEYIGEKPELDPLFDNTS